MTAEVTGTWLFWLLVAAGHGLVSNSGSSSLPQRRLAE